MLTSKQVYARECDPCDVWWVVSVTQLRKQISIYTVTELC